MLKIENTPVDDNMNKLVVKSMYIQSLKRNQKTKEGTSMELPIPSVCHHCN